MHEILRKAATDYLKENLSKLSTTQQTIFKRMYSKGHRSLDIDDIIENMDSVRLDWAIHQVEATLNKSTIKE